MDIAAAPAYRLSVETVKGRVMARRHGQTLAVSDRAKVMHETRLPSAIYFPPDDVAPGLLRRATRRTFCPFKGTASYWDLVLKDETVANGAWSYERALPEAKAVQGYIAFMPGSADAIETDDPIEMPLDSGNISGALVNWLMREAWVCNDPAELTAQIGRRFGRDGIAVRRLTVVIWSLHPQLAGYYYQWIRDDDAVTVSKARHENLLLPAFANSPIRHVADGLGGVRQPLTAEVAEFTFPVMADLQAKGYTDYVAMPLLFSDGQINVMTLATDHLAGFTTANLGLVFECAPVIGRFYEVLTLKANAASLLTTYLGARTGARVLGGEIRRGDGDEIRAAILFCDLRDSTALGEQMSRDAYLALLNQFFETVTAPINNFGGEVLKFIGDAVLAIFPDDQGVAASCSNAQAAAEEIAAEVAKITPAGLDQPVSCAIGVHFGHVTYGNVGAADRLDFTVVGTAANVAARLADLCKLLQQSILLSADVAHAAPGPFLSCGLHALRNIEQNIEVFTPQ